MRDQGEGGAMDVSPVPISVVLWMGLSVSICQRNHDMYDRPSVPHYIGAASIGVSRQMSNFVTSRKQQHNMWTFLIPHVSIIWIGCDRTIIAYQSIAAQHIGSTDSLSCKSPLACREQYSDSPQPIHPDFVITHGMFVTAVYWNPWKASPVISGFAVTQNSPFSIHIPDCCSSRYAARRSLHCTLNFSLSRFFRCENICHRNT